MSSVGRHILLFVWSHVLCVSFFMQKMTFFFRSCVQICISCCCAACLPAILCVWLWLALHPRTCMSLVWPLAYLWTHYLCQHSGMAAPHGSAYHLPLLTWHLVSDSGWSRPFPVLLLTLPLWTRQRPFEGCPCLIPPPRSALTACVYQPVQVRQEETLHEGEINRQEKSMGAASMSPHA